MWTPLKGNLPPGNEGKLKNRPTVEIIWDHFEFHFSVLLHKNYYEVNKLKCELAFMMKSGALNLSFGNVYWHHDQLDLYTYVKLFFGKLDDAFLMSLVWLALFG